MKFQLCILHSCLRLFNSKTKGPLEIEREGGTSTARPFPPCLGNLLHQLMVWSLANTSFVSKQESWRKGGRKIELWGFFSSLGHMEKQIHPGLYERGRPAFAVGGWKTSGFFQERHPQLWWPEGTFCSKSSIAVRDTESHHPITLRN